jgi:hypothetical protein
MKYKTGDIVWYIDSTPKIRRGTVRYASTDDVELYESQKSICTNKLFPTKEALLAAIDPPLHNFVVGQTVWYIEEADNRDTLRIEKACVISTTNETVEIRVPLPSVPLFNVDLNIVFDNPQDAVAKALELKQWL